MAAFMLAAVPMTEIRANSSSSYMPHALGKTFCTAAFIICEWTRQGHAEGMVIRKRKRIAASAWIL